MFIQRGVYSVLGGGGDKGVAEWVMEQKKIPVKNYEKLAEFFNPESFNAKEWVSLAKAAGMKYITAGYNANFLLNNDARWETAAGAIIEITLK